jgi:hypothetical protein
MARDMFGEEYTSNKEYGLLLADLILKKERCLIETYPTEKGIGLNIVSKTSTPIISCNPGLYALFLEDRDDVNVYVGQAASAYNRVYRFFKEYHGKSRYDEQHPGGRLARKFHPNSSFTTTMLTPEEFPVVPNWKPFHRMDEVVAGILNTTCNTNKL